jgi:hypothetical protein
VQVTGEERAAGFFTWPTSLRGKWETSSEEYKFELRIEERKRINGWIVGGFAMGIVSGRIYTEKNGRSWTVVGLGELLI